MNTVDFAKTYAERGMDVFPLKPRDKTPLVKWADVASHEVNMAVGWFENDPRANIAIATGKRSGVIVVDIDASSGGYESLADLLAEHGPLPRTPITKTGGGGEHIFFAHPNIEIRNSASRLAPGIDVRGDGGYVVAAPSIHPNGNAYEWVEPLDIPLAPMPDWMLAALKDTSPKDLPVVANGKIINGHRNDALARKAGAMRRQDFSEDEIFVALKLHNEKNCVPPLSDGEVLRIAKSISRYAPPQEAVVEFIPTAEHAMDELEAEIKRREADPREVWGIHFAWPRLSRATGGKQLGEFTILAGEPGVGKSYWAHQDALFTAIGTNKIAPTPSLIWCGEMKRRQVHLRMCAMLGVSKHAMKTGYMTPADWQAFNEASALIRCSPLRVSDAPLDLKDLDPLVEREAGEYGVQNIVIDYDWLIHAKGEGEIETSQNISRACKVIVQKYNVALMLISSVSKAGMDTDSENITKSKVSGSGKKLHDADNIFMFTKYHQDQQIPRYLGQPIMPPDYFHLSTLTVSKSREMDDVANAKIAFYRPAGPRFYEIDERTNQ